MAGIVWQMDSEPFKKPPDCFLECLAILHFHQQYLRVSLAQHSYQSLTLSVFFVLGIRIGVQCYLIIAFICIFLMANMLNLFSCLIPVAAATNYHKPGGLKQPSYFIVLEGPSLKWVLLGSNQGVGRAVVPQKFQGSMHCPLVDVAASGGDLLSLASSKPSSRASSDDNDSNLLSCLPLLI